MISYLEGVVLRDASGRMCVVSDEAVGTPRTIASVPATMHPLAARGIGHRLEELERHADRGGRVIITLESDPDASILEVDEIAPADLNDLASARALLAQRVAA